MFQFRAFFAAILAIVLFCTSNVEASLKKFSAYGFFSGSRHASVVKDTSQSTMMIDWARVGVSGTLDNLESNFVDNVYFKAEAEVYKPTLKMSYAQLNRHMMGGDASLAIGLNASPGINSYAPPKSLPTIDWPAAFYGYSTFTPGATLMYEKDKLNVRFGAFARNRFGARIAYSFASVIWEEDAGYGVICDLSNAKPWYFHPNVGWSHYFAGAVHPRTLNHDVEQDVFYAQNHLRFGDLRAYVQYEWGDMAETWIYGLNLRYMENSSLKIFHNTATETISAAFTFYVCNAVK